VYGPGVRILLNGIPRGWNTIENGLPKCILVVDDEKNIADTLVMVFKIKGHESMAAYSAENAVEAIESFEPDVVLSDVIMGKMTGVDLAIADRHPNLPQNVHDLLRAMLLHSPHPRLLPYQFVSHPIWYRICRALQFW
jgi:hypothetical protein